MQIEFIQKIKGSAAERNGLYYRSILQLYIGNTLYFLHVAHATGKPRNIHGDRIIPPNSSAELATIEDAKKRYPRHGGTALIKETRLYDANANYIGDFALKCFYRSRRDTAFTIRNAEREVSGWRALGENFAGCFTRLHSDGSVAKVYLLMPWVKGVDLFYFFSTEKSARIETNFSTRLKIAQKIFEKLKQLIDQKYVLTDLKSENIMINLEKTNGTVEITLVDLNMILEGMTANFMTRSNLDPVKSQMVSMGYRIPYDWYDQMYAFGLVCHYIFSAVEESTPDKALLQAFAEGIRSMFANENRIERPGKMDPFPKVIIPEAKESPSVKFYANFQRDPYLPTLFQKVLKAGGQQKSTPLVPRQS